MVDRWVACKTQSTIADFTSMSLCPDAIDSSRDLRTDAAEKKSGETVQSHGTTLHCTSGRGQEDRFCVAQDPAHASLAALVPRTHRLRDEHLHGYSLRKRANRTELLSLTACLCFLATGDFVHAVRSVSNCR